MKLKRKLNDSHEYNVYEISFGNHNFQVPCATLEAQCHLSCMKNCWDTLGPWYIMIHHDTLAASQFILPTLVAGVGVVRVVGHQCRTQNDSDCACPMEVTPFTPTWEKENGLKCLKGRWDKCPRKYGFWNRQNGNHLERELDKISHVVFGQVAEPTCFF